MDEPGPSSPALEDYVDASDGSDAELQLAFQKGWIKPGLNYTEKAPRPKINNIPALQRKLNELRSSAKAKEWIERMDVTVARSDVTADGADEEEQRENDFQREMSFYNLALDGVKKGLPKLEKSKVPIRRPKDYYAEMVKSEEHMRKIQAKELAVKKAKEKTELVRKMRQEKKFALQKQREAQAEKQHEKRQLLDAVKQHRKGLKDQLNTILDKSNKKPMSSKKKRAMKDKKYGLGGKKRGLKMNTAESSADIRGFRNSKKIPGVKLNSVRKKHRPKRK